MQIEELNTLVTEQRNLHTMDIDRLSTENMLRLINKEDQKVIDAINDNIFPIAQSVELIAAAFQNGGRLFYVGAGTSGRLGILDASECPPTYGTDPHMVQGLIAGGSTAILNAVENAEDDPRDGENTLKNVHFCEKDILVGIAASGRTPWVIGAMVYARSIGAKTISLSCNKKALMNNYADISIVTDVGPEVITGSTRMKSGSAHKMVLNMLSTGAMIKIGKVYSNFMVDVKISNEKLALRARNIIMQATGVSFEEADTALNEAGGHSKVAIVMILRKITAKQAKALLNQHKGIIRNCID